MLNPAKVAYLILLVETTINLAYYKDIVFGFVTIGNYVGMYLYSINRVNSQGVIELDS